MSTPSTTPNQTVIEIQHGGLLYNETAGKWNVRAPKGCVLVAVELVRGEYIVMFKGQRCRVPAHNTKRLGGLTR